MNKKQDGLNNNAHRVITFLTRDELDFIDKVSKDALFSAGSKLSRSKIISAIVSVMLKLQMDGCGLSSKKELEARIYKAMKNISEQNKKSIPKLKDDERKGEQDHEPAI